MCWAPPVRCFCATRSEPHTPRPARTPSSTAPNGITSRTTATSASKTGITPNKQPLPSSDRLRPQRHVRAFRTPSWEPAHERAPLISRLAVPRRPRQLRNRSNQLPMIITRSLRPRRLRCARRGLAYCSYLNETRIFVRYVSPPLSSTWMSWATTSATLRSRSVPLATLSAAAAASSQDSALVPMRSVTR